MLFRSDAIRNLKQTPQEQQKVGWKDVGAALFDALASDRLAEATGRAGVAGIKRLGIGTGKMVGGALGGAGSIIGGTARGVGNVGAGILGTLATGSILPLLAGGYYGTKAIAGGAIRGIGRAAGGILGGVGTITGLDKLFGKKDRYDDTAGPRRDRGGLLSDSQFNEFSDRLVEIGRAHV